MAEMATAVDGRWDRRRASRLFALGAAATLKRLAASAALEATNIEMLQEPTPRLVMMESGDPTSSGSLIVGEILVTSAQVALDGEVGCSVVMGADPGRAEAAAILDAVLQGRRALDPVLARALEAEERRMETEGREEPSLAFRTRVQCEPNGDRDCP